MSTRSPFLLSLLGVVGLITACGDRLEERPRATLGSGGMSSSPEDTTEYDTGRDLVVTTGVDRPIDDDYDYDDGQGGAGPIILPPFDCADPMFFPLRIDDDGNIIDEADVEVVAGGGATSSNDLTVLLVFDKSGSMAEAWGGKSRWQAGSDALLLGLDGILDELTIGGIFFPFDEPGAVPGCGVPAIEIAPQIDFRSGRGFKEQWIAGACAAQPQGSTPLEHALQVAELAIDSGRERGMIKDRMRVVLVTDGEPTCEDSLERVIDYPRRWSEQGIETHVIGLPGSQAAADLLDEIAEKGGTDEHFAPAQLGELEEELYHLLR